MATCDSDRLSWSGHSIVLANSLYRLYMQSNLLDVRLVCDEAHIYAHKAVLAAGSQFFLDRLQSLGAGMVELQMSTANLGMLITPNDLRAVVEYLYCGELLVPHHRLPQVLALVRSLQVFGFQNDGYITGPEPQFLTPAEMNYVSLDASGGMLEIPAEHLQVDKNCGGLAPNAPLPLITIKPHEHAILQDPLKYSEPLKIDTNVSILGASSSMSFSELCTAPGADTDTFVSQCSQVKNVPSVFESSVLGEASTIFKRTPDCSEAYSKPDQDILQQGTVLHFREDVMVAAGGEGGRGEADDYRRGMEAGEQRRGERVKQQDARQVNPCMVEADTDDTYNTVMLLEALVADASSVSGVDVETLLLPEESRLALSPRWVRSRRPLRPPTASASTTATDSRARLKVKDSIGGVSLQDTSQRQDTSASVSREEEVRVREGKESWKVVLSENPRPPLDPAYHSQVLPNTPQLPKEPLPLHIQTPPILNRSTHPSTLPFASPLPMSTSLLATPSCPSNMSVHPHPVSTLSVPTSLASPSPLLPQSNFSLAPYLQTSVLPAAVVNQTDFSHISHTLPTIPIQTVSVLDSETPVSYTQNVSFSQPPSSPPIQILSQSSSLLHLVDPVTSSLQTGPSVSHLTPLTQSFTPTTIPITLTPSPTPITDTPNVPHLSLPPSSIPTLVSTQSIPSSFLTQSPATTTTLTTSSTLVVSQPTTLSSFVIQNSRVSTTGTLTYPVTPSSSSDHPSITFEIASSSSPVCRTISTPPVTSSPSVPPWPTSSHSSGSITTISLSDSPPLVPSPLPKLSSDTPTSVASSSMELTSAPSPGQTSLSHAPLSSQDNITINHIVSLSPPTTKQKTLQTSIAFPISSSTNITTTGTVALSESEPIITASSPAPPSPILVLEEEEEEEEEEEAGQGRKGQEEEPHWCSQCARTFKEMDTLTLHLWNQHEIGTLAKCQLCEFSSPLQSSLVKHAASHITATCNTCAVCNKHLKTRATVRTHLRTHRGEEDMYKCEWCPVMYSQKFNLIKHLASKHQQDAEGHPLTQPLSCPHCPFTTLADHKLKAHIVRRHTVDKPFKCDLCSYATTEKPALAKHTRTHTKERPYVCETCGFHAPTLSSLWRHRRSHTGEKPFECAQCGQQYADSKRLRDHMYKHNNIKPFMCHKCGYTCRRKDNLQTHLQKVHKLHDHKESASARVRNHTRPRQAGKTKRGTLAAQTGTKTLKASPELTQSHDNIKIKTAPEISKLQVWTEHSYDTRSLVASGGDRVVGGDRGSVGEVMECGEMETGGGRDVLHSHTPFTTTTISHPATLQSPGCVTLSGGTSTLQLGYLLPLPAHPPPSTDTTTLALTPSADGGIILVGQHPEVAHTAKPYL